MVTIVVAGLSSSMIIIWFIIELNLISFIGIIMFFPRKTSKALAIKYFSFQVNVSVILFFIIIVKSQSRFNMGLIINIILIAKVGMAPFHMWFVSIISKVN